MAPENPAISTNHGTGSAFYIAHFNRERVTEMYISILSTPISLLAMGRLSPNFGHKRSPIGLVLPLLTTPLSPLSPLSPYTPHSSSRSSTHSPNTSYSPALHGRLLAIFILLTTSHFRGVRVAMLLAAIIAMSFADLWMTLTYATTTGMMEMNPIAHFIMQTGSVAAISSWKLVTAGLGVLILYLTRTSKCCEFGAWVCFTGMILLMAHWSHFNANITTYSEEISYLAGTQAHQWVEMR